MSKECVYYKDRLDETTEKLRANSIAWQYLVSNDEGRLDRAMMELGKIMDEQKRYSSKVEELMKKIEAE